MNRSFKLILTSAVFAVFGIVNAQEAPAPAAPEATVATPPVPAPAAPEAQAPASTPAPAAAAEPAPAATLAPQATPAPVAVPAPALQATDSVAVASKPDSGTIVLIVNDKKKKRGSHRFPKTDFAIVDIPANFEIQARKVMPVDSDWGTNNLDTWWGRANLMVLAESENFVGKLHLRMYPSQFYEKKPAVMKRDTPGTNYDAEVDLLQLYEAWAWHRSDYVNIKVGRWDNTTRFGSMAFGGYVDAKKDKIDDGKVGKNNAAAGRKVGNSISTRKAGFMSTYYPENAIQFGLNNLSENLSLDIALITSDENLNRGDLRTYFKFKELAGIENMEIGIGYRSNVFDGIYSKKTDVTHNVDIGIRAPIVKDLGILKGLTFFGELALIGLDDQPGSFDNKTDYIIREDGGNGGNPYNPAFPILGGFDIALYRGLDKIVIEAEYDSHRRRLDDPSSKEDVRDVQGSIFVKKALNDRFTINLGVQSEGNTKDFSFAGRLQGRIN